MTDMPIAGIQDETWVWTALQTPAVGEEAVPVENIQEVYMYPVGGDFTDYPVEGQGSREVEPGIMTTYE